MWSQKSHSSGSFKVGNPYKVGGVRYVPEETYNFTQTGIASWYGPNFHGKYTANGEIYNQNALTAAHKTLQIPAIVRVTNLENGRSIIVRVNDRGPFSRGRIIDMSRKGAELLQFHNQGTAKVKVQVLPHESRIAAQAAKRGQNISGVEIALNEGKTIEEFLGMHTQTPAPVMTAENELTETMEAQGLLPSDMDTLAAQKRAQSGIAPTAQPTSVVAGQSVQSVDTGMNKPIDPQGMQSQIAVKDAGTVVSEDLPPPVSLSSKTASTPAKSVQTAQANLAHNEDRGSLMPMPGESAPAAAQSTARTSQDVIADVIGQGQDLVKKVPVGTPEDIFVQAGSFGSKDNATAYASKLSSYGQSQVHTVEIGNRTFYRVRLGPVDTVEKADAMLEKLAQAGENQAIIILGE